MANDFIYTFSRFLFKNEENKALFCSIEQKNTIFAPLIKKTKGKTTMIIVQIKEGENLEKSLRAFKKKFDRIGIVKELRARKVYNKPSVVRRQKKLKAVLRQKYLASQE